MIYCNGQTTRLIRHFSGSLLGQLSFIRPINFDLLSPPNRLRDLEIREIKDRSSDQVSFTSSVSIATKDLWIKTLALNSPNLSLFLYNLLDWFDLRWNHKAAKMVLAELGGRITRAIQQMSNVTIIDEKALNECLNEITRALLQSDVSFPLVKEMKTNIKNIVNLEDLAAGHNKRRIIEQVSIFFKNSIFFIDEICLIY